MKKISLICLLLIFLLTSCEFFYNQSPYKINIITIGQDYKNNIYSSDDLNGTLNDANDISDAFKDLSTNNNVDYDVYEFRQEGSSLSQDLIDTSYYPSKANVVSFLSNLNNISDENTINFIFYSGHGANDGSWALATTDLDEKKMYIDDLLSPTEIYNIIQDKNGKTVIISDSCYSGNFYQDSNYTVYEEEYSLSSVFEKLFSSGSDNDSIFFISATESDNTSHEPSSVPIGERNHGFFTKAFLDGLGWDDTTLSIVSDVPPATENNILSLDSIIKYVKDNQEISLESEYLSSQYPQISGWRYDLVLFSY